MKKYRVVQCATGGVGKNCLRALIDHPAMEFVGVYVCGADKKGRNAGTIARREPTGVIATRNVDGILALDADVVTDVGRADRRGRHGDQRNSHRLRRAAGHRDAATGHPV